MFISSIEPDKAGYDKKENSYQVTPLIIHCNDRGTVYKTKSDKDLISKVKFFVRSISDNLVVYDIYRETCVFDSVYVNVQEGITLNDFMLLNAKELLLNSIISTDCSPEDIALSSCPTPFGELLLDDGTYESMFQLVIHNRLKLSEGYMFVPFDNVKGREDFQKIAKTFRKTGD